MERPQRPFYTSLVEQPSKESANDATNLDSLRDEVREIGLHTAANDVSSSLEKIDRVLNYGILHILELIAESEIESIDLSDLGIASMSLPSWETEEPFKNHAHNRKTMDTLGAGHTCYVIRHAEYSDVGRLPRGTVVAIKKFVSNNPSPGEHTKAVVNQTLNAIEQEIRIYCHPGLRNHPNICRLEYVGWEAENVFPSLALELADHGSLEDVLTASGTGPSYRQRCNLSIDIALGIAALHEWEIVHGDIKPANILVQKHSIKGIVAKISDFGGTINHMINPSRLGPGMGTELWWPPERIFSIQDLNFKKIDVYAYGLVVASIWFRPNAYLAEAVQSSCILDNFMSQKFAPKEKQDRLLLMKTERDSSEDSVLSRCVAAAPLVERVLKSTLARNAKERKTMDQLLQDELSTMRDEAKRTLDTALNRSSVESEIREKNRARRPGFSVWSKEYRTRSRTFQNFVSRNVHEGFREALKLLEFPVMDLPDYTDQPWRDADEFLDVASRLLSRIKQDVWEGRQELRRATGKFALDAAIGHFTGTGVQIDNSEARKWLHLAALAGYDSAVLLSPLIDPPIPRLNQSNLPYRLFLVVGALVGLKESLALLRTHYPSTYHATLQTLQSKRRPEFLSERLSERPFANGIILSKFLDMEAIHLPTLSLRDALESHNQDTARSFLLRDGTDASSVDNHNVGIMHCLSFLEDSEAAKLVNLCYKRGARLDIQAESQRPHLLGLINGTPLAWAVSQNMENLFKTFLELHKRHCIPIVDFWQICYKAAETHSHHMLASILDIGREAPRLVDPRFNLSDHNQKLFLQLALGKAMMSHSLVMVERRIRHGPVFENAYKQTLLLLLEFGADPFYLPCQVVESSNSQPRVPRATVLSLEHNDEVSMQIFVNHHRSKNLPVECFHDLIAFSILESARMCFGIIVDAFPDLVNQISAHASTSISSPLRAASICQDSFYARTLLDHGAEFMNFLSDGYSPLESALTEGCIATADEIYNRHNDEQLKLLWIPKTLNNRTTMGKLVYSWLARRNTLETVKAMRWVESKGGASFFANANQPVWNIILYELPPPLRTDALQNNTILNTLFDIFWDKLEYRDAEGLAPIHRAAKTGNLEVLQILLDKGVDVNLETISPQPSVNAETALNLAMKHKRDSCVPSEVRRDPVVLKTWPLKMQAIIRALVDRNAGLGSGSTIGERLEYLTYKSCNICSIRCVDIENQTGPLDRDNSCKMLWPRPLPKDETSPLAVGVGKAMNVQLGDGRILELDRSTVQKLMGPSLKTPDLEAELPDSYKRWLSQAAHDRCQEWRSVHSRRRKHFDQAWSMLDQDDTMMMTSLLLSDFVQHTHDTYLMPYDDDDKAIKPVDPSWSQFHYINTQRRHTSRLSAVREELEHDPTLLSLPIFNNISYIGPKLSRSIQDQNLQHLIDALKVNANLETGSTNDRDASEFIIIDSRKSNPGAELLLQTFIERSTQLQSQDKHKFTHLILLTNERDTGENSMGRKRAIQVDEVIAICLEHVPKDPATDDESTLYFIDVLCSLYSEKSEMALCAEMNLRALEGYKRLLGPDHRGTLDSLHSVGYCYLVEQKLAEAEKMLSRALDGKERALGPIHMSTLETIYLLGVVFESQGRWIDSEAKYLLALERYTETPIPDDSKLDIAMNSLNSLHAKIFQIQPAQSSKHRVYSISKLLRGKSGGIERIYGCLGNILLSIGDSESARTAYYYQYLQHGSSWNGITCHGCQRSLVAYGLQRFTCELCQYTDLCEDCYPRYRTDIDMLCDCKDHSFLDLRFRPSNKSSDEVKEEKQLFLQLLMMKYYEAPLP
ncbi:hypothetical protein MMC30_005281 [Trapelia coarctata]|nr:hypothetical protein [Trapelia coarctata]